MKVKGFHEGDRSEFLAQYALSAIGHCVPVPRPADYFGVDMYMQMFNERGQTLEVNGLGCLGSPVFVLLWSSQRLPHGYRTEAEGSWSEGKPPP